ncbi:hypothetical protein HC030_11020 [Planosporangium mesophilum]|nr:hypothetical protein [Planosporangium mesophilum]
MRMVLDYPDLADALVDASLDQQAIRKRLHLNWTMMHLRFGYLIGELPETAIRTQVSILFAQNVAVEWWAAARGLYEREARNRRQRRFLELVDSTYEAAITRARSASAEHAEQKT